MPAVQVKVQLSANKLMEAVASMGQVELEQFLLRILALKAQRKAPHLSAKESELLINCFALNSFAFQYVAE